MVIVLNLIIVIVNSYIEIPDKNGNITRYNCNTCSYEEIINNKMLHMLVVVNMIMKVY